MGIAVPVIPIHRAILPRMRKHLLALFLVLLSVSSLHARVVRVDVASRTDVLGGKTFGEVGAYERIAGKVYFSVAIGNVHNHRIVDLDKAVNLKNGEVEFSADFVAILPKDPTKSNGSMLLENPNRGRPRILALIDGGDWNAANDAGDAWFFRNGFTYVSLGWQWDAAGADALKLYAPIAKEIDGRTITGLLRGDLMPSTVMGEIPLGHLIIGNIGGSEYPPAAPDDPRNTLTVRDLRDAPRTVIARSQWQFVNHPSSSREPAPSPAGPGTSPATKAVATSTADWHIHLNGGFQPGKIYEYVYVVQDPVVAGLAFAAVRDFASYAKHTRDAITPAARVFGEGISQNGRFLRNFLYDGFNADEDGRIALDGVLAHVAGAGRGSFNYRFAQPSRDAQPTSSIFFPTDIFPFTDLPEKDPLTGNKAGLLDRAAADKVVPKVFFSNTSYEYWGRVCALIHVTPDGKNDAPVSENVRIYHFTGLQHFSGPFPPKKGEHDLFGQQPQSPLPIHYFWRSMLANMDAWVRNGTLPPPSSYPKIGDGNLVSLADYAFPKIPGVNVAHEANAAYRIDFGSHWQDGILTVQPPKVGEPFPVLVPQVDADGNERDGIRLPEITVPLATYASWNLRDPSIGAPDQRVAFEASYIPFAKTAADRQKSGDPRKSIAERYSNREDYMAHYTKAVDDLVKQRWILPEDRESLLQQGEKEWDLNQ